MEMTARQLCEWLGGKLEGNPDVILRKPAKIETASAGDVTFLANPKYENFIYTTQASAVVLSDVLELKEKISPVLIRVPDPYLAFSKVLGMVEKILSNKKGIEQPAFNHSGAKLGSDVYVGAFSYISERARIGNRVKIYPHCWIDEDATIDDDTCVYPGVKIYRQTVIGKNCVVHAGVVIGSDGFGFAPDASGVYAKVPQTGNVVIEDNVEVGANSTIDRASMGSTIIHKGVKIDNLCQIAHNVEVGENTVMAAGTAIAGSTKIGKQCVIGGQVGFAGHLSIADGTMIQAKSGVGKNITEKNTAIGGAPSFNFRKWQKSHILHQRLPELEQRLRRIEQLLDLKSKN